MSNSGIKKRKRVSKKASTKPLGLVMHTGEKRSVRLRARRRRRRAVFAVLVLATILIVGIVLAFLSHHPRFAIQKIEVHGARELSPEKIRQSAESIVHDGRFRIMSNTNILTAPKKEIENSLKNRFPRIRFVDASISSLMERKLSIEITEREPYALWCNETGSRQWAVENRDDDGAVASLSHQSECYSMDIEGVIFDEAPGIVMENGVIFSGGIIGDPLGEAYLNTRFTDTLAFIEELSRRGFPVRTCTVVNEHDFDLALENGTRLRTSFNQELPRVIENLETALGSDTLSGREDDLEYIDLRFGNRIYFKFLEKENGGE